MRWAALSGVILAVCASEVPLELQHLSWSKVQHLSATAPSARYDATLCGSSGRLFLFGGFPLNKELWFFDVAKSSWAGPGYPLEGTDAYAAAQLLPPVPWPAERSGHVALVAGDKLVLFGGWGVNTTCPIAVCGKYSYLADMWELDLRALPSTYVWRQRLPGAADAAWPPARWNHAAVVTQTSAAGFGVAMTHDAYVFGGFDGRNSLSDLWRLQVETGTWTQLTQPVSMAWPSARESHTLALLGSTLFLHGGVRKSFYSGVGAVFQASSWSFELAPEPGRITSRWTLLNASAVPLSESAAISPSHMDGRSSGALLRIGGVRPSGERAEPFLERLNASDARGGWHAERGEGDNAGSGSNASSHTSTVGVSAPPARLAHTFAQEGHKLYVFGGRCDALLTSTCYYDDLWASSFVYPELSAEALEAISSEFVPAAWEQLGATVPLLEAAVDGSHADGGASSGTGTGGSAAVAVATRPLRPSARAAAMVAVVDPSKISSALAAKLTHAVQARVNLTLLRTGGRMDGDPAMVEARRREVAARAAFTAVADGAAESPQLMVFGGLHGEGKGRAGDLWFWDMLGARWKPILRGGGGGGGIGEPDNRGAMASAVVVPGSTPGCAGTLRPRIFMFGGFTFRGYSDQLWSFEHGGAGWVQVPGPAGAERTPSSTPPLANALDTPSPTPAVATWPKSRDGHSLVAVGRELWMFGGEDWFGVQGDLWTYDLCAAAWSTIANFYQKIPAKRFFHAAAPDPNGEPRFYMYGGRSGHLASSALLGDLWVFDTRESHRKAGWRELTASSWSQPTARYGHGFAATSSAAEGTKLWVFGGHNGRGFLDDLWVFRVNTLGWLRVKPLTASPAPLARSFPGFMAFGGSLLVFGGYNAVLGAELAERDDSYIAKLRSIVNNGVNGSNSSASAAAHLLLGPPPNITGAGFFRDMWVLRLPNMSLSATPPPPPLNGSRLRTCTCNELCPSAGDGVCDDGGIGYAFRLCPLGSDCADCGTSTRNSTLARNGSHTCPAPPPLPLLPSSNTLAVTLATLGAAVALAAASAIALLPRCARLRARLLPARLQWCLHHGKVVPTASRGRYSSDDVSVGHSHVDGKEGSKMQPVQHAWAKRQDPQGAGSEEEDNASFQPPHLRPALSKKKLDRKKNRKPLPYNLSGAPGKPRLQNPDY